MSPIDGSLALADEEHALMHRKWVFINEHPVGEAASWQEVRGLLRVKGILFFGAPIAAESPGGFHLAGTAIPYRDATMDE